MPLRRPCWPGLLSDLFSSAKEHGSHGPPSPAEILTLQCCGEFIEPLLKRGQVKGRIGFSFLKAGESAYMAFITDHCGNPIGAAVDGPGLITDAFSAVSQQGTPYAGNRGVGLGGD